MANEKRNASIDITKFILALIVVMLHSATECLGTEHMAVRVIEYSGRFVVQFFLMVSGYYFTKMLVEKGTGFLRFFVRMMKIYLLWSAVYISLSFAVNVLLNGENVNAFIRTEEVSMMTSDTSKYKKVREKLLDLQRNLAKTQNVIMDGRDIGTCVLPDAPLKIYLTASSKERARRRYKEQQERGIECDFEQIEKDIIARDKQDMNRAVAPLKKADDAVVVDASDMTIEEVVRKFMDLYKEKSAK